VVGIRERLKNLERAAEEELVIVELEDGTSARFREEEIFPECFLHELDRMGRELDGEEPGPAHPFVEALKQATNLDALASEHGTMIVHFVGEDEILRGVRERPGPPVKWNEEGTVCE
jgi:hypothetical protein